MPSTASGMTSITRYLAYYIVRLLRNHPSGLYQAQIMAQMETDLSTTAWRPSNGAFNPLLHNLEDVEGYLASDWDHAKNRTRRLYNVTEKGEAYLAREEGPSRKGLEGQIALLVRLGLVLYGKVAMRRALRSMLNAVDPDWRTVSEDAGEEAERLFE